MVKAARSETVRAWLTPEALRRGLASWRIETKRSISAWIDIALEQAAEAAEAAEKAKRK